jgi:phosphoglycolate phosphatase-like HAD superfamily hydrolase
MALGGSVPIEHTPLKILLDLDGPILDVSARHHRVYADIVRTLGCRPLSRSAYWHLKRACTPLREILARSRCGTHAPWYAERWVSLIELPRYLTKDRLVKKAHIVLKELSSKDMLHLVTSRRNRRALLEELALFGIDGYFASITCAENPAVDWRAKRNLITGARLLREGEPALIVGDTEGDIRAGKSLGIVTCAVLNGIRNAKRIAEMKPDYTIRNIGGLPRLIQKIVRMRRRVGR